ncbi:MAG TPA: SDR family oxidoreductase [Candidatus Aminicenantes bacterium]|mgnify:CR=1 FL=1|nr:SDR family oxidoreductase [Candidatus Aminicenantes bacterium]
MLSLKDKIVFVTGASSGIGRATAEAFAGLGARILMCARRADRLEALARKLESEHRAATHYFRLDVRDRAAVDRAVAGLPPEWRPIEVLVNNAGLSRGLDKLPGGLVEDWEEMIDTNIKGLLYVTRAVLAGMLERGRGHVINIGSVAGREVYPAGNVYCASKFAVRALTRGLRLDLNGTPIRVSEVAPGMVETEFSLVRFHGDAERAGRVYQGLTPLGPDDIADAVVWCATRPAHVNVSDVVIWPTAQASTTLTNRG